ncbi:hypothetical protein AMK34_21445 [Amycolatopsis sp. CB00013]|nr:hypothetical protein AMK34_21445 [Amycolatopsis sp. CB00013]
MNPEKLRQLHETALQAAAKSRHPVIAEMAREVLAGRLTLREAVTGAAYREAFTEASDRAMESLQGKTIDDLRRAATEVPHATPDDEPAEGGPLPGDRLAGIAETEPDDAYFDQPIMSAPSTKSRAGSTPSNPDHQPPTRPRRSRWSRPLRETR